MLSGHDFSISYPDNPSQDGNVKSPCGIRELPSAPTASALTSRRFRASRPHSLPATVKRRARQGMDRVVERTLKPSGAAMRVSRDRPAGTESGSVPGTSRFDGPFGRVGSPRTFRDSAKNTRWLSGATAAPVRREPGRRRGLSSRPPGQRPAQRRDLTRRGILADLHQYAQSQQSTRDPANPKHDQLTDPG